MFLKAEFSFTASWRRLITRGQADGFLGGLLLIAIAAAAVVPVAKLVPGYGGAIAPIALRINPEVSVDTNEYIRTGERGSEAI